MVKITLTRAVGRAMPNNLFSDLNLKVTAQLRAFLRAELAQVVHFISIDGELWNPHKIAREINDNPDIIGSISDDTIVRFLDEPMRHNSRRAALEAIASFLLAFEFISERDLQNYGDASYDRAASALAQLYKHRIDPNFNNTLLGFHRHYQTMGADRLVEWSLTLGSPDAGLSLSAVLGVRVFVIEDLDHLLEATDQLGPGYYSIARDQLSELEADVECNAPGVAALTPTEGFIIIGGDEAALQSVLTVEALYFSAGKFSGAQLALSSQYAIFSDDIKNPSNAPNEELFRLRSRTARLIFYPQGKHVQRLAMFDENNADSLNGKQKGRSLSFQGVDDGNMSDKDQFRLEGEQYEFSVEEALAACPDETARLAAAIDMWRADHAVAAIKAGADVNAMHEERDIPMVHAAASLGMSTVIEAMRERDVDLTVRDRFNRLPSACTGDTENTIPLRDMLAAAQARQLQAKGMQPGAPKPPEND